jgi:two-component system sensor histidine kinase MtrB
VYREILANLPEVTVQIDSQGQVLEVNRPDAALFAKPPRPESTLVDLFDGSPLDLIEHLVETAASAGVAEGEVEIGNELYRVVARHLRTNSSILLYFQDVTVRRRAEHTLMEVVRDKSSFLETVSHQLRAPLTAVVAYADMLSRSDTELDDATRTAMVEHMTDRAWDLAGIVEDLLAIARTDIGDLRVVSIPFDLSANARQVIESMGYRGADIQITGDKEVTGVGDPTRFRQIVRNLLSNALDHGAEPVSVNISADDDRAVLSVMDRGPGVSPEMEAKLFTRFVTSGDPGTPDRVGIGLLVSTELAALMGGRVTYSREHGLTVFRTWVPLHQG